MHIFKHFDTEYKNTLVWKLPAESTPPKRKILFSMATNPANILGAGRVPENKEFGPRHFRNFCNANVFSPQQIINIMESGNFATPLRSELRFKQMLAFSV